MEKLVSIIKYKSIKLLIWDFDGVLFKLDWYYQSTPYEFLESIYNEIQNIDDTIIKDKREFINRLSPYLEINQIGIQYGKDALVKIRSLYQAKENTAIDGATPILEVIDFIRNIEIQQAIWSNNHSSTIKTLLKRENIDHKIKCIVSLDKVVLSKPHPEGFKIIQNFYPNILKEEMLLIGDSLISDKVAAENTGIGFYHYGQM